MEIFGRERHQLASFLPLAAIRPTDRPVDTAASARVQREPMIVHRKLVARLLQEGRSVSEVARTFNVHPATIYRCIEMPGLRPRPKAL